MGFTDMDIAINYRSDANDIPRDFLIPVLKHTICYKRAVGFFSTSALLDLSIGLFDMAERGGHIELICSPKLDPDDIRAIDLGYKTKEEAITQSLLVNFTSPITAFEQERLNLVATMIADGMLDLKIAFMETDIGINVYHEKIAVFVDEQGNRISFTGSMNESGNAFANNFESIFTFCSWKDESQKAAVCKIEADFDRMWEDNTAKLKVIPFPQIVIDKLMQYKRAAVDYQTDDKEYDYSEYIRAKTKFHVPAEVILRDYQKEAVSAWIRNDYRGVFSMATGAGKTFTALACTVNLAAKVGEKLAVFIVCPYIHLVSQWEEDVEQWCPLPIIAHSRSPQKNWEDLLRKAVRRFFKDGTPFVCITTNDTFAGPKIQTYVSRFTETDNVLFIVDEAHNAGAEYFAQILPENFQYRIALSATIKRYMDKTGTQKIFDFFGSEVINYDLEDGIKDGALVHYEYYPIPVALTSDELDEYEELSRELKRYLVIKNGKMKISDAGKPIVYKRTRLLAGAANKVPLLMSMMQDRKNDKNILIYCGATTTTDEDTGEESRQIDLITEKLRSELGMSVMRFTAEEDLDERRDIKKYFVEGLYQVITAIKCLDEGVNIPGIETAFVLSSSRNPKEFVQRRGRLLRKSPGKTKAYIFDFVTLPREIDNIMPSDYQSDKSLVIGELFRVNEFGRLSDNPYEAEHLMNTIMAAYDISVDVEEEAKRNEDYYAE